MKNRHILPLTRAGHANGYPLGGPIPAQFDRGKIIAAFDVIALLSATLNLAGNFTDFLKGPQ